MTQSEYVVLGAGIVGLYTTYCLINEAKVSPADITVLAEFLPGDQSVKYTSPWAGGNFSCIAPADPDSLAYDKYTYTHLGQLQKTIGGADKGIDRRYTTEYFEYFPSAAKVASMKTYLDEVVEIPAAELPDGIVYGIRYLTWNFFCPKYLGNIFAYLQGVGVHFQKKKATHIVQAYFLDTKVVFNCTGLGSLSLGGVKDVNMYPLQGQVVVINAPHIQENRVRHGITDATYIIPRPFSNGQLIIGGFLEKDSWVSDTSGEQTKDIIARTTKLMPEILDRPIDIVATVAGLRPGRYGGARIEAEHVEGKLLVHNYGAAGYGYQSGFGMAHKAVALMMKETRACKL